MRRKNYFLKMKYDVKYENGVFTLEIDIRLEEWVAVCVCAVLCAYSSR